MSNEKTKTKLKVTLNSPIILVFVALCFIATLLNYITNGATNDFMFSTYRNSFLSPMTWIRSFTHVFGHADWGHLVGNVSYLLLLGPMLEEKYKKSHLIEVIVITALITSLFNAAFFSTAHLCGASGVVFAFIMLSSFTSFREGELPITFILVVLFFVGQQIFEGVTSYNNISYMAHIVGGIVGAVFGYLFNKRRAKS
ncbi:MAG: rhomboid family intramembrane serine protease [Lachnospiraceae bacterium]|nr:rhomboid family intramembrane serine protease [Lachnospiraceae bacterium]